MDDVLIKTGLAKDSSMDVASHFILRAAYCRTEELRRWFLLQETALFRHRIEGLSSIQHLAKHLHQISASQKEHFREALLTVGSTSPAEFAATPYYAIPFTQALDLIKGRNAYVHGGLAYVPLPKLVSILANDFRMHLSQSLTFAAASFGSIPEEGARIKPLLQTMNSQYTGANRYEGSAVVGTDLTAASIETLKHNMPLCMSELHRGLERDHKLKHWGRLQYGLFLKGAGMSMEESLLFFQRAFAKVTSPEGFQKQYAYGIRHMYGKEGKRASYTPYPCPKIILGNPPQSGDHHGCPFRHYDDNHLAQVLGSLSLGDKNAILSLKKNHNYQLACAKHFEVLHPHAASTPDVQLDNVGNHPNAWFAASVSYHSKKLGADKQDVEMEAVAS
jgi:DNA primase large subunit